jgi:hypothetical protein
MTDIDLNRIARDYASRWQLHLAERLGFGIHGIVHAVEDNFKTVKGAIKVHRAAEPYFRERQIYERLRDSRVSEILGFHVPQLIRFDDRLRVIEMSVVTRPFLLDFAGAYLDEPPEFSEEIWSEWEAAKREQFEGRWSIVQSVLAALEGFGVHMIDVSPSNVAFLD